MLPKRGRLTPAGQPVPLRTCPDRPECRIICSLSIYGEHPWYSLPFLRTSLDLHACFVYNRQVAIRGECLSMQGRLVDLLASLVLASAYSCDVFNSVLILTVCKKQHQISPGRRSYTRKPTALSSTARSGPQALNKTSRCWLASARSTSAICSTRTILTRLARK